MKLLIAVVVFVSIQSTTVGTCTKKKYLNEKKTAKCLSVDSLLDSANWQFFSETEMKFIEDHYSFRQTTEGLVFYGTSVRYGGRISTKNEIDIAGKSIYVKWKVDGGYNFNNYSIAFYYDKNIPAPKKEFKIDFNNMSTSHSYAGSSIIENDVWYFSRIEVSGSDARCITSIGNYDDEGGTPFNTQNTNLRSTIGWLAIRSGDTYSGRSTFVTVCDFRVVNEIDCNSATFY